MTNKKPYKDARGRYIHPCMADECTQHGAFGFDHGAVWYCGQHRHLFDATVATREKVSRETPKTLRPAQGRLL